MSSPADGDWPVDPLLPPPADGDEAEEFGDFSQEAGPAIVRPDPPPFLREARSNLGSSPQHSLEQLLRGDVEGIPELPALLLHAAGLLPTDQVSPGAPTWTGSAAQARVHRLLAVDRTGPAIQDASPLLCALPSPPPPIIIPRRSFSPPPPARGALRLGLAKLKRAADDAERRMIIAADRAHTAVSTAASSAAGAVMTALKG